MAAAVVVSAAVAVAVAAAVAVSNESPVSTFETGSRISVFQSRVRDGIENFFLPVSRFETRSRFSFFQSRASRRAREFFSFNLVLRDEHENFST
jgi:hypothetical protein